MREIKFRGYDKENQCWRFGNLARLQEGIRKFWAIICENLEDGGFVRFYIHNEKSIGQYTGLKDKNGVEIYEGDIFSPNSIPVWVEYDNEDCCYVLKNEEWGKPICRIGIDSFEVIGNIYENPELLEDK